MSLRSFLKVLVITSTFVLAPAAVFAGDALSIVPSDAMTVAMVSLVDMRTSPLSGRLFTETDHISADGETERFMAEAGLKPQEDVDKVVVAMSPGKDTEPRVIVAFEGRFDPARLAAALIARGGVKTATPGGEYVVLPDSRDGGEAAVVSFVSPHLVLAGHEPAVVRALSDLAGGGTAFFESSGLGRELRRIDPSATSWLLVDVQRSARFGGGPNWGDASRGQAPPLGAAMKTVAAVALWATDAKDSMKFGGSAVSYDAETRQLLEDSVRGLLAGWRLAVQDKNPELVPVLRKFEVGQTSDSVTFSGSLPAELLKNWAAKEKPEIQARAE